MIVYLKRIRPVFQESSSDWFQSNYMLVLCHASLGRYNASSSKLYDLYYDVVITYYLEIKT